MRKVELPLAKGFLSPANGGNEGGVKTIERRDSYVNLGEIRARSKNSSKNLVVSPKTLIFAGVIEIKIKNYGKDH